MKQLLFMFAICLFFVGCNEDADLLIKEQTSLFEEISPNEVREYHSEEAKKDHDAFISGALSIDEVIEKYNIDMSALRISKEELNALLLGEEVLSDEQALAIYPHWELKDQAEINDITKTTEVTYGESDRFEYNNGTIVIRMAFNGNGWRFVNGGKPASSRLGASWVRYGGWNSTPSTYHSDSRNISYTNNDILNASNKTIKTGKWFNTTKTLFTRDIAFYDNVEYATCTTSAWIKFFYTQHKFNFKYIY